MWNVIFGRGVGVGGRGFGVDRDEQASVNKKYRKRYLDAHTYATRFVGVAFRFFFFLFSTSINYRNPRFRQSRIFSGNFYISRISSIIISIKCQTCLAISKILEIPNIFRSLGCYFRDKISISRKILYWINFEAELNRE